MASVGDGKIDTAGSGYDDVLHQAIADYRAGNNGRPRGGYVTAAM